MSDGMTVLCIVEVFLEPLRIVCSLYSAGFFWSPCELYC